MSIDKPLQAVVDDEWKREEFAKAFTEKQKFDLMMSEVRTLVRGREFDEALELLSEAKQTATGRNKQLAAAYFTRYYGQKLAYMAKSGEVDEALELVEADLEAASAESRSLKKLRIEMLIEANRGEQAAAALTELAPELDGRTLNAVAWSIYERAANHDEADPKLIDAAINAAEIAVEKSSDKTPMMDTLSHLVYLQGDVDRALEIQEEAVKVSKRTWPEVNAFLKKLQKEVTAAQQSEDPDAQDQDDSEEAEEE